LSTCTLLELQQKLAELHILDTTGIMDRALSALSISKLRGKSSKDLAASFTASREYPADPACYELLEDCGRGVSATVRTDRRLLPLTGV
jgi:hypothetical protein